VEFVSGALAAQLYMAVRDRPLTQIEANAGSMLAIAVVVLIAAMFALMTCVFSPTCGFPFGKGFINYLHLNFFFAIPISILLFCVARYDSAVSKCLSGPILVYLGNISYSIYLSHLLINGLFSTLPPDESKLYAVGAIGVKVFLTIALSTGTYMLVEALARKWIRGKLKGVTDSRTGSMAINTLVIVVVVAGLTIGTTLI